MVTWRRKCTQRIEKFIHKGIEDYSEYRNFPSIKGTSKLSPLSGTGKYVETFGRNALRIKKGLEKFLAEIGWREFNHSIINNFPHM